MIPPHHLQNDDGELLIFNRLLIQYVLYGDHLLFIKQKISRQDQSCPRKCSTSSRRVIILCFIQCIIVSNMT